VSQRGSGNDDNLGKQDVFVLTDRKAIARACQGQWIWHVIVARYKYTGSNRTLARYLS
jgi:hypothetical protein